MGCEVNLIKRPMTAVSINKFGWDLIKFKVRGEQLEFYKFFV